MGGEFLNSKKIICTLGHKWENLSKTDISPERCRFIKHSRNGE